MSLPFYVPSIDFFRKTLKSYRTPTDGTGVNFTIPHLEDIPCSEVFPVKTFSPDEMLFRFTEGYVIFVMDVDIEDDGDYIIIDQDSNSIKYEVADMDAWPSVTPSFKVLNIVRANLQI